MIGSSLLFLRVRPGARESVHVTERGVPESEAETVAIVPAPEQARAGEMRAAPASPSLGDREAKREKSAEPMAEEQAPGFAAPPPADDSLATGELAQSADKAGDAGTGDETFDRGMADYRAGRYAEAQKSFDEVVARGGSNTASAALFSAQSLRHASGCSAAAPRFESVGGRYRGTGVGNEATWQAADCYRALGHTADARRNYQQLVGVPGYEDRAQQALASLDEERVASRKAAAKPPAAKAAAKPAAGAAKKTDAQEKTKAQTNEAF